jgi:hypothetical protein
MQNVLAWAGDNPIGRICALLFAFLVVGSITGSVMAAQATETQTCWPKAMYYTVYVECENEFVAQVMTTGVGFPVMMLQGPVSLLVNVTTPKPLPLGIIDTFTLVVTPLIVFFGFAAWTRWAPAIAWLLLLALIGEIVYLRSFVPI